MISTGGVHSWLLEYIHKCKSGDIIIGRELMAQLDILLGHFHNPDITIDFSDAHKRIRFIESECKHYEAPFAGKPFVLELFEKAVVEAIYSFKIFDPEIGRLVRLYQELLYLVGRKNGKTPFISAICLAEFFCGPLGIKTLCSSNDYEQADLMFQAINSMREQSPRLERLTRCNIKGIYYGNPKRPRKHGKFSYENKGSIRKITARKKAKEGRNIGVGAVDECHELEDNTSTMPIRQALSTQDEPLYFELTTEGFTNDGYLDGRLREARQVLAGELERPRWLIWLYTQDSEQEIYQDESTWEKSNPGIGVIKKKSFLRNMLEEAKTNKATRVFVLAKDFNIKQNNAAAWLSEADIVNEETFRLEDFRGAFALGAVDLSKSGDLSSAKVMLIRNGKKHFLSKYWIPESKLERLTGDDKRKYEQWKAEGLLEISPGNENDFRLVTAWFVSLVKQHGIRFYKIGYDKWSAIYWVKEMEEAGFDMVRIEQTWGSMSQPMELTENDLHDHLIIYNNHPIDRYCLENTAIAVNSKREQMPVKIQGKEDKKIDGTVTMIIAQRVYIDNRSEFLRLSQRAG